MKLLAPTVALAALAAFLVWYLDPSHALEREARAAAEAARVAQQAQFAAERAEALAPWVTGAQIAGVVIAVLLAAALATSLALWVFARVAWQAAAVLPTPDGRLPVPAWRVADASVRALGATHARGQLAATEHRLDRALTWRDDEPAVLAGLLAEDTQEVQP